MLWEDFANCFNMLSVCKMIDNASSSNCELPFSRKNAELFEFETAGGNVTLTLSQPSPSSSSASSSSSPSVSRSIMIVAKQSSCIKGFEYNYISSSTSNLSFDHNLELTGLSKGNYVVYAKCLWNNNQVSQIACLSIYMEYPTHMVHVSQSKHKRFLYQTFLDHARNNPKKQSIGPGEWVCNDLLLKECGYGYLAFHLDEQSTRKIGIEIAERYPLSNAVTIPRDASC